MINESITALVNYGIKCNLICEDDRIYVTNILIDMLGLDEFEEVQNAPEKNLAEILDDITNYAQEQGICDEGITARDLFDTKIMGVLTPRPSEVRKHFAELQKADPRTATDWFYKFSTNTNYIRKDRIEKDLKWKANTEYGELDITVNLSKPEKDPKAIAAAKNAKQSGYPKCMLCRENEGYAGRINHPARQNHRIIPVTINGSEWCMQYSPYVYYNEHCIVFNGEHLPMSINHQTFTKLLDFITEFPHYFVGSNADLPIVGGSILSHDHFQGGHFTFAMEKAPTETPFTFKGYETVEAGIVKWPMSVIRLTSCERESLEELACKILDCWRAYSDPDAFIFAKTDNEPHNTITPIARMCDGKYQLDLVLRNNITTEEHPLGVFHPHAELHHIKKENIGLIEVMGLAVLPARLKGEIEELSKILIAGEEIAKDSPLAIHTDWVNELKKQYTFTPENTDTILKQEIGKVFSQVLSHAGVFKRDEKGKASFLKFLESVK